MRQGEEFYVYFRIQPSYTNYVNRILEGYEYLGVMTTVDKESGRCMVRTTDSTRIETINVLKSLPIELVIEE